MKPSPRISPVDASAPKLTPKLRAALGLLVEGREYCQELHRDIWDFAVEIDTLRAAGLSNNDFRWLGHHGYIASAVEVTLAGESVRSFRRATSLQLVPGTCFILTEAGCAFATARLGSPEAPELDEARAQPGAGNGAPGRMSARSPGGTPCWDRDRQELRLGGLIVKQFKVPAPNQEMVLAAFEEEQWPPRIDDPLPPSPGQEPKRRLHETIASLNRNQRHRVIRFMGDGSGEGVRWEPIRNTLDADADR